MQTKQLRQLTMEHRHDAATWMDAMQSYYHIGTGTEQDMAVIMVLCWALEWGYRRARTRKSRTRWLLDMCGFRDHKTHA